MKLLKRTDKATRAALNFYNEYSHLFNFPYRNDTSRSFKEVFEELLACGSNPSVSTVDKITVCDNFTSVGNCTECGEPSETLITFCSDDEERYDVRVCGNCVSAANKVMND